MHFAQPMALRSINKICRNSKVYPVRRLHVPDKKSEWTTGWPDYDPPSYTDPDLLERSWADPDISPEIRFEPKFNELDGAVDRRHYDDDVRIDYDVLNGYPMNPVGRTGLSGRGRLGRWGPNHAGDAIVTRWKRCYDDSIVNDLKSGAPILQFIGIKRKDCGEWAIPGGFVSPNELSSNAVVRQFCEEVLNKSDLQEAFHNKDDILKQVLDEFFMEGDLIYKGYVDDPRSTDNAWIITTAVNFHDEEGKLVRHFPIEAGDDASDAAWLDIHPNLKLYASHLDIIKRVAEMKYAFI